MSSASALAGTSTAGSSLFLALMKTTTTKIIVAAAAALLITSGTVRYFTREGVQNGQPNAGDTPAPAVARADKSQSTSDIARTPATAARHSPPALRPSTL